VCDFCPGTRPCLCAEPPRAAQKPPERQSAPRRRATRGAEQGRTAACARAPTPPDASMWGVEGTRGQGILGPTCVRETPGSKHLETSPPVPPRPRTEPTRASRAKNLGQRKREERPWPQVASMRSACSLRPNSRAEASLSRRALFVPGPRPSPGSIPAAGPPKAATGGRSASFSCAWPIPGTRPAQDPRSLLIMTCSACQNEMSRRWARRQRRSVETSSSRWPSRRPSPVSSAAPSTPSGSRGTSRNQGLSSCHVC
jgi:hypothetical protein